MFHGFFPVYFHWWHIPVLFLAGLIGEAYGSVIGGGGIVLQAAQLFIGIPIKSALAIGNAGVLGTEFGVISETHQHIIANKKLVLWMMVPFTIGGILGTWLLLSVSPAVIKYLMIVAVLALLVHTYRSRGQVTAKHISNSRRVLLVVFMILAGLYGNFIGPGEGTFSKFALMTVLGLTFVQSQGLKAAASTPARIYSLVVTSIAGLIIWPYVITFWVSTFIAGKYATKIAKRIPDKYLMATLTVVSVIFVIYLLFFY